MLLLLMMLCMATMLSGCYHRRTVRHQAVVQSLSSERQRDSISFYATHHYTNKFNFLVHSDSLFLTRQQPEEMLSGLEVDSFCVKKNHLLVVTDIRMVAQDSIDSVWVQLATEDNSIGWSRESNLLPKVVPDDPISQFIMTFSNVHLLIFLVIIVVIAMAYLIRKVCDERSHIKIVHYNDIDSPYPTALVILVACSAAFYATIQNFAPDTWRHFYFHPTLNPFAVPCILGFFLAAVWSVLIVGLACVDEVHHRLPLGDGILYLGGLASVCALDYIIFSVLTLYYVGYVLLVAYVYFAVWAYRRNNG